MSNTKFQLQTFSLSSLANTEIERLMLNVQALRECEYGSEFPAGPSACQFFVKTTDNCLYQRNIANTAWIQLFNLNTGKYIRQFWQIRQLQQLQQLL